MADNLIFPIGFDLDAAVEKAGKEWNSKYAAKLEKLLEKRAIAVKLKFDTSKLSDLDSVKRRLAELKIEPITPENRSAIRDLVKELRALAQEMQKVQKYSNVQTPALQQALANKANAEAAHMAEKYRQANERVEIAKRRVILAEQKHAEAVGKTKKAYGDMTSYIQKLTTRMAAYWSVSQVSNFITKVREVTAEFELQRISLGAIIQDQARANQLFSEIKSFALQSPVSILDLTKYTKQLAAYKIGVDELFETTKKLTDVAVGLGVSMDRVVLAYGQIRATGHLRASEVRQLTEMGVPIVEELAKKLSAMNGELVRAADVMDMISKREISFEQVKEVFDDMTSAGGIFYDMQIKQGNTLAGMWAKLGDAASVMYDEIGNTESVNKGMKSLIGLLTDLMRNWQSVANVIAAASIVGAVGMLSKNVWARGNDAFIKRAADATRNRAKAQAELNYQLKNGTAADKAAAQAALNKAKADESAAIAAKKSAGALAKVKAGLGSLFGPVLTGFAWGAIITGVTALISAFVGVETAADKARKKIQDVFDEYRRQILEQKKNFETLADAVVNAIDGSKEQKEALDELRRTYGNIIPVETLSIENLRKMRDGADSAADAYSRLTDAINDYYVKMRTQSAIDETKSLFAADVKGYWEKLLDNFESPQEFARFKAIIEDIAAQGSEAIKNASPISFRDMVALEGFDPDQLRLLNKVDLDNLKKRYLQLSALYIAAQKMYADDERKQRELIANLWGDVGTSRNEPWIGKVISNLTDMSDAISGIMQKRADDMSEHADRFSEIIDKEIKEKMANMIAPASMSDFEVNRAKVNKQIQLWADAIKNSPEFKNAFQEAGVEIKEEWFNVVDNLHLGEAFKHSTIDFDAMLTALSGGIAPELTTRLQKMQEAYNAITPSDQTVQKMREYMDILVYASNKMGAGLGYGEMMSKMQKYIWDGTKDYDQYIKGLKDDLDGVNDKLYRLKKTAEKLGDSVPKKLTKEITELSATANILNVFLEYAKDFQREKDKDKGKSDLRLQNLKEEISLTKKLYEEYLRLEKQIGATQAKAKIQKFYANTIAGLEKNAQTKYGFTFALPFTPENLKENINQYIAAMKELQRTAGKKFPTIGKDIDEATAMLGGIDVDVLSKEIEKRLKELSERIARTKTAKEFYDKILSQTGDIDLAANVTMSVYGETGAALQDALLKQIQEAFAVDAEGLAEIDLPYAVDMVTGEVDYNKLAELEEKYGDILMEGRADLRKKLIDEGRKTSAAQAQQWLKDIEKAKDYAQQRIELAAYTANQIAAINARRDLDSGTKSTLIQGYREREAKQMAKLEYEEFKDSAMYVHIFEDLDNASTTALKNMRNRLVALKGQWKNLDPTQVKELTKAIADLDAQIAERNPFKALATSFKELAKARPQKLIDADLAAANTELDNRKRALEAATKQYTEAQTALLNAQAYVAAARESFKIANEASGGEETPEVVAARNELALRIEIYKATKEASEANITAARRSLDDATEQYNTQKAIVDKLIEEGRIREANILRIKNANQAIDKYQSEINEALDGVRKIMEAFDKADEDLQFFDDVVSAFNEIVDAGQNAALSVGSFMSGDTLGGITQGISAIGGLVSGVTSLFTAVKDRKANKEIEKQAKELERLESAYSRLERSAEKAFGTDYLRNVGKQLKTLRAEAEAYRKQAEAEKSKGKSKDEDALKEYQQQYSDTLDAIADKQNELRERLTGTGREDLARKMAESWIDARASMSNTFDAIKGDYKDMIRTMIVEGMAAKIVDQALTPMWDSINSMLQENDLFGAIDLMLDGLDKFVGNANSGLEVMWRKLEARGYDIKNLLGDSDSTLTGISRGTATATSEEINANTAALTTQNWYMSQIYGDVRGIRTLLESTGNANIIADSGAQVDFTALTNRAMENLDAIARHTSETVTECRKIAATCAEQTSYIKRVVAVEKGVGVVRVKI